MSELRHLVVGLGNPGAEYAETRHNVGFRVLDGLASASGTVFHLKRRLTSAVADAKDEVGTLLLCKPQTFMNLSGQAVAAIVQAEGIDVARLLVVFDDADLELGDLRLRGGGGSGGHRGVASILASLGNENFARLRMGIGRGMRPEAGLTEHVLGKFSADENNIVNKMMAQSIEAISLWRREGLERAMNQWNGKGL